MVYGRARNLPRNPNGDIAVRNRGLNTVGVAATLFSSIQIKVAAPIWARKRIAGDMGHALAMRVVM